MRRPSYAAVVAHVALAIALSGGAMAAVTVNGASIKSSTVTGNTVKDGSLTGADLRKHSVGLDRLSSNVSRQFWSRTQADARYLPKGASAANALTALGFTRSNKEAKRKIAEGAVRLDEVTVNDPTLLLTASDEPLKLSLGKKRHGLLIR